MGIIDQAKRDLRTSAAFDSMNRNTSNPYTPESNSSNAGNIKHLNTNNQEFRIGIGTIMDTLPHSHLYRVSTSMLGTPIVCHALQNSLVGYPMGASCTGYPVGTDVLVAYSSQYYTGVILGGFDRPCGLERYAFRTTMSGVTRRYSDSEFTNKSIFVNWDKKYSNKAYHAGNMSFDEHGDVPEWGFSCITGMKMFVDPYMALLGSDDYTNLSIFYQDSLLRVSALNYQLRTSGREDELLNDDDEYMEYKGMALMPYEHFCYTKKPSMMIEEIDRETWYKEDSTRSPYEPALGVDKHLCPFHRVMEFGGWLGQGKVTQVVAPPETGPDYLEYADRDMLCLARLQSDVSGRVAIATTKGVSITKDGFMPAAVRKNRPDDITASDCDNRETYKHYELTLPKEIKKTAQCPSMQEILGIMDYSGYYKNWNEMFQLAYHTYDYYYPEETAFNGKRSINAPSYAELAGQFLLKEDETYEVKIDEQRNYKEYTQNEAGIHILPSGGIVIYDGSGSELRFVKGQITLSCAGDINIKPGRNINLWAGNDLIERANRTVDISSSNKSVRIKAEKNLELLGANDGSSDCGVIIESKSKSIVYDFAKLGDEIITNGIVLKAEKSPVALLGQTLFLRSGVNEGDGTGIYLDSGKGASDVYIFAKEVDEYIKDKHTINFAPNRIPSPEYTTLFSKDDTFICGDVIITKGITMDGEIVMEGDLVSCGSISSYGNKAGTIFPFGDETREKWIEYINKHTDLPEKEYPELYKKVYSEGIEPAVYEAKLIGSPATLKGLSFSFRTDQQIELPGEYYVYEDLWQHIANNSDEGIPATWEETSVICSAGTTYPFPGKNAYVSKLFVTQESVIADFKKGVYIDRQVEKSATAPGETKYKEPEYGKQEYKSLNEYPVVK